jgi:hypothetical protein
MTRYLTRRRDLSTAQEGWAIFFGDVRVGSIGLRAGVPSHAPQWSWSCGFYPGTDPGERASGIAETFEEARRAF